MAVASPWVRRWSHLVPDGGTVLDVACGSGRHVGWFSDRGCRVTGVDRDAEAVAPLRAIAEICVADIEAGPWPFGGRSFDAVVVTNYLWRLRLPDILAAVAPGGLLIYETFGAGQAGIGRPARAEFLLQPGELLRVADGLRVIAFEDGFEPAQAAVSAGGRYVQRIVAARPDTRPDGVPPRDRLGFSGAPVAAG